MHALALNKEVAEKVPDNSDNSDNDNSDNGNSDRDEKVDEVELEELESGTVELSMEPIYLVCVTRDRAG